MLSLEHKILRDFTQWRKLNLFQMIIYIWSPGVVLGENSISDIGQNSKFLIMLNLHPNRKRIFSQLLLAVMSVVTKCNVYFKNIFYKHTYFNVWNYTLTLAFISKYQKYINFAGLEFFVRNFIIMQILC